MALAKRFNVNQRWFDDRLAMLGRSQREMAFAIGLDPAQLNRTLKGIRKLSADEAALIANFLEVPTPTVLKQFGMRVWQDGEAANVSALSVTGVSGATGRATVLAPAGWNARQAREAAQALPQQEGAVDIPMLPLFSQGTWEERGEDTVEFTREPSDYIQRPTEVLGVKTAYAVRYPGGHMSPRYKSGDVLIVDPSKGIQPGAEVIVHLAREQIGDAPLMKAAEFVRREGGAAVFKQYSPEAEITVGREQILHVHRIVAVQVKG